MSDFITAEKVKLWVDDEMLCDKKLHGMYRRFVLKPASQEEWADPAKANGVPILARKPQGRANVNHKLHMPFDRTITNQKVSYFASDVKTVYGDDVPDFVQSFYEELEDRVNWDELYLSCAESGTDRGTSYILLYNKDGYVGVTQSHEWNSKVIYDPLTGLPVVGLRYFEEYVEVYDNVNKYTFVKHSDGSVALNDTIPHGFGTEERPGIPLVELPNNTDRLGNVELTLSLQDAYDCTLSDLSSEVAQMRLAYLLLKGMGQSGDNSRLKEEIKKAGILLVDSGDGDAKFITKDLKVDGIKTLMDALLVDIYQGSSSYDPNGFVEGSSPTAYQVAQRLHPLEQDCKRTIGLWKRSLNYYDYLLQTHLMTFKAQGEYPVRDIKRVFTRNIPRNALGALKEARDAGLTLSQETLMELSGLEINIQQELDRINGTETE